MRPFLTRKFFQDILGLEGSKTSWEKKCLEKFPQEKKARILPAEENFEPKISWRQEEILRGNFTRKFLDHFIIELKSVQDEAYPFLVLHDTYCYTYTRLCSLLYSHMHRVTQSLPQEP